MGRKAMSNALRFKILQRDNFTCQYCGEKAPQVTLEIDHIYPVSRGGGNNIKNLITSCKQCNRGKHARVLTSDMNTNPNTNQNTYYDFFEIINIKQEFNKNINPYEQVKNIIELKGLSYAVGCFLTLYNYFKFNEISEKDANFYRSVVGSLSNEIHNSIGFLIPNWFDVFYIDFFNILCKENKKTKNQKGKLTNE